jgi:hypothetical protein
MYPSVHKKFNYWMNGCTCGLNTCDAARSTSAFSTGTGVGREGGRAALGQIFSDFNATHTHTLLPFRGTAGRRYGVVGTRI